MSFNTKNIGITAWSALETFAARLGLAVKRAVDALRGRDDDFSGRSVRDIHDEYWAAVVNTTSEYYGEHLKVLDLLAQVQQLEADLDTFLGMEQAEDPDECDPTRKLVGPKGAVQIHEDDSHLFDTAFEELRLLNEARSNW